MKNFNLATIFFSVLLLLVTACSANEESVDALNVNSNENSDGDSITLGSRNNTESIILSNIMGQLIEADTDIEVIRKDNLGGSNVLWNGLLEDEIQLIPDYTGTVVANYYQKETGTAEETLAHTKELIEEDGLVAFNAFGFNNTYTLSLDDTYAEENGIETFSDFADVSDQFTLGAVFEFIDRPDGLPGFEETYNLEFADVKGMDHGMMYRSYSEEEIDVINSYTTDGQLQVYDVRVLEDDLNFFPPYHAVPIIRQDALEEFPELEEVLALLEDEIDEGSMQVMNGKVDNDGLRVDTVAEEFLKDKGLID